METADAAELPLTGIKVLDLTRALSGPFCTALLGDFGADVVKVEGLEGELCRSWGPWEGEESLYFLAANRNKRSLALDLWSRAGREVLRQIVGQFDVVVENFRPGVLEALGIGAEWMAANHPDVIVASISGFGHIGPDKDVPCFDQVALGAGGLMSLTGTAESGPLRLGIPLADTLAGMFSALGICAALAGRSRVSTVHTSLLESVLGVLTFQGQQVLSGGETPARMGNDHPTIAPYGVFRTADQPINLAAAAPEQWRSLWRVLGAPEMASDPRFARPKDRVRNRVDLATEIEARLTCRPSAEWLEAFRQAAIPAGPINDVAQALAAPQVQALGTVKAVEHPTLGTVTMAQGPLWFNGEHTPIRRVAPRIGEHSREVLAECGLSTAAIDELVGAGTVAVLH